MLCISRMQGVLNGTFKILNGIPNYISIEQLENQEYRNIDLKEKISELIEISKEFNLQRLVVLLIKTSKDYHYLSQVLNEHGFIQHSSNVEVYKDLQGELENNWTFSWRSLQHSKLSDHEFIQYWRKCTLNSENKPSPLTMEQQLDSLKSEIGKDWRLSCRVFYEENRPIGITIPILEPGTTSEGRIFYFGIFPEERGKGKSSFLHLKSLTFLKEMGASYYIGSTDIANKKMQKVFRKNGCIIKKYTELYHKHL